MTSSGSHAADVASQRWQRLIDDAATMHLTATIGAACAMRGAHIRHQAIPRLSRPLLGIAGGCTVRDSGWTAGRELSKGVLPGTGARGPPLGESGGRTPWILTNFTTDRATPRNLAVLGPRSSRV